MKESIKIAIDLMGGENSPDKNLEGANLFAKRNNKIKLNFHNLHFKLIFFKSCDNPSTNKHGKPVRLELYIIDAKRDWTFHFIVGFLRGSDTGNDPSFWCAQRQN